MSRPQGFISMILASLWFPCSSLIDLGHSVIVIEHQPDIIKCADWIIDVGPEAGKYGGEIVFAGTPEELAKNKKSQTARFIKEKL